MPILSFGFATVQLGWTGYIFSWALILAFTNIYNFMDGIDGLAASEGALVALAAGVFLLCSGNLYSGWLFVFLSVALLGFLPWNWQPARVFMGDVGSNLLGFAFATAALATGRLSDMSSWIWAILLGVFVVDGLLTFGRRLARKLPPYQAHLSHAYQGAVEQGFSHARVTTVVLVVNVLLVGVAILAWFWPRGAFLLMLSSYALLAAAHYRFSPLRKR